MKTFTIFYEPKWLKGDKMSKPFKTDIEAKSEHEALELFHKFYPSGRIVKAT